MRFLILLLLTSCSFRGKVMTLEEFEKIEVGFSEERLVEQFGKPDSYDGCHLTYVERISSGRGHRVTRRYTFYLEDGRVVSKDVETFHEGGFVPYREL